MIETKGSWISPDVVVYSFETEDSDELATIYKYRQRLMSKFVSSYYENDIEATRILTYKTPGEENLSVDFEFTLRADASSTTPEGLLRQNFDRIVRLLFTAVKAQEALEEAKEQVNRYRF